MGAGGQRHAQAALPPGKGSGTYCREGWVGPRAGLDGYGEEKPLFPPASERWAVRTVASRYTD